MGRLTQGLTGYSKVFGGMMRDKYTAGGVLSPYRVQELSRNGDDVPGRRRGRSRRSHRPSPRRRWRPSEVRSLVRARPAAARRERTGGETCAAA